MTGIPVGLTLPLPDILSAANMFQAGIMTDENGSPVQDARSNVVFNPVGRWRRER
jgi:hypothetical protein